MFSYRDPKKTYPVYRIPNPGVTGKKGTGSRILIRTTTVYSVQCTVGITCPRHNQAGYFAVIHLHTTTAPRFADPVTSTVRIRNLHVFGQDSLVIENSQK